MLWLHGIFGSGQNFRSLARALVAQEPSWGACLVDLRGHGQSPDMDPPHTLDAVAHDVLRLEGRLPGPVEAVLGHSFGGKVALAYMAARAGDLRHAIIVDASPSARADGLATETAGHVLAMLEGIAQPLPSRERFVEIVVGHGYERPIAEWLAMNVRRAEDGFRLRVDLGLIRALLDDYFAGDLWAVVEAPRATDRWMVLGGRSPLWRSDDRGRLDALAAADARVHVEVVEGAGHWVHADDPVAFAALVQRVLAR